MKRSEDVIKNILKQIQDQIREAKETKLTGKRQLTIEFHFQQGGLGDSFATKTEKYKI